MKPMLFNTPMVRAILAGRKTVTRRAAFANEYLKEFPHEGNPDGWWFLGRAYESFDAAMNSEVQGVMSLCKYRKGDILYVRENWSMASDLFDAKPGPVYMADYTDNELAELKAKHFRWHPSIHMPRDLARIYLRVTDVRVERLRDIFNDPPGPTNQIVREGCAYGCDFIAVWENSVPKDQRPIYGYYANPWVWVIEFERISKEDALSAG